MFMSVHFTKKLEAPKFGAFIFIIVIFSLRNFSFFKYGVTLPFLATFGLKSTLSVSE